jgi:acyl-coenzyme A thioesterase PaaI-like protein
VNVEDALVHHELCFGCGRTNLFGLLLEARRGEDGGVAGRCFIKQDHQGPDRGYAHDGVVATALAEAMTLGSGPGAQAQAVTVAFIGKAPVGSFLAVEARIVERDADTVTLTAGARSDSGEVARARGTYSVR